MCQIACVFVIAIAHGIRPAELLKLAVLLQLLQGFLTALLPQTPSEQIQAQCMACCTDECNSSPLISMGNYGHIFLVLVRELEQIQAISGLNASGHRVPAFWTRPSDCSVTSVIQLYACCNPGFQGQL